jgi:hypothetical protein
MQNKLEIIEASKTQEVYCKWFLPGDMELRVVHIQYFWKYSKA